MKRTGSEPDLIVAKLCESSIYQKDRTVRCQVVHIVSGHYYVTEGSAFWAYEDELRPSVLL